MDTNGENPIRLTDHRASDQNPTWSPDGTQIMFRSNRDDYKSSELYVVNVDGSKLLRLTNSPGDDWHPAWSPMGDKILFASNRSNDANTELDW